MRSHKINSVITLGKDLIPPTMKGISVIHIKIDDSPLSNLLEYIPKCVEFISNSIKLGNVFVHCRAGISRSATIVIAYLMFSKGYSLNKVKFRFILGTKKDKRKKGYCQSEHWIPDAAGGI